MMKDKSELLQAMRAGRTRLEDFLLGLDDARFEAPGSYSEVSGWSYKDLLAHFGYWEGRAAHIFSELLEGRDPPEDNRLLDEINQEVYERGKALSAAEVRQGEAVTYQRLLGLVERASEADLFDAKRFPWTGGLPYADWIAGNSFGHYEEHGL